MFQPNRLWRNCCSTAAAGCQQCFFLSTVISSFELSVLESQFCCRCEVDGGSDRFRCCDWLLKNLHYLLYLFTKRYLQHFVTHNSLRCYVKVLICDCVEDKTFDFYLSSLYIKAEAANFSKSAVCYFAAECFFLRLLLLLIFLIKKIQKRPQTTHRHSKTQQ